MSGRAMLPTILCKRKREHELLARRAEIYNPLVIVACPVACKKNWWSSVEVGDRIAAVPYRIECSIERLESQPELWPLQGSKRVEVSDGDSKFDRRIAQSSGAGEEDHRLVHRDGGGVYQPGNSGDH